MQKSSHARSSVSEARSVSIIGTSSVYTAEELVRLAGLVSDAKLGLIKEKLMRTKQLRPALDGVAAIMSTAKKFEIAEAAFRLLHFSYLPNTSRYIARKIYVAGQDLDGVTQDVWISIWLSHHLFRPGERFTPWMWTIVNRRLRDWLGKWSRQWAHLDSLEDHQDLAETLAGSEVPDRFFALNEAIQLLAPRYRSLIRLRFVDDYSLQDIADATGQSISTVKAQNARALQSLRELLRVSPRCPRENIIQHCEGEHSCSRNLKS